MSFRIAGLDPDLFRDLFELNDKDLAARGARRVRVEEKPGAPCRISLDDAEIGEMVLLPNYDHLPADTPYRQQGPIFVGETATRWEGVGEMPPALARRTLSLRAFDASHMMVNAELAEGSSAQQPLIERFFEDPAVAYIHAHYAKRGCFAALVERA